MTNLISREEAVTVAGLAFVKAVEAEHCEPTSAVGRQLGAEWAASVRLDDGYTTLVVVYYTTPDDQELAEASGDWGNIDWQGRLAGYRII